MTSEEPETKPEIEVKVLEIEGRNTAPNTLPVDEESARKFLSYTETSCSDESEVRVKVEFVLNGKRAKAFRWDLHASFPGESTTEPNPITSSALRRQMFVCIIAFGLTKLHNRLGEAIRDHALGGK